MKKKLGYGLMIVGVLGCLFFLKYKGSVIPIKELWFVLSFFIALAGAYIFIKDKVKKLSPQQNDNNRIAEIEHLKLTGDKVRVTLEAAEVKTRSYQKEITNTGLPSRIETIDAFYDSNRNYKTEEILQTYIVFYKEYNGKMYKFISQATPQSSDAVKWYIEQQKGIDLYVDKNNPENYYFDLPYL